MRVTPPEPKAESSPRVLLFFDTETTGLPSRDRKVRADPLSWPRLVELGWVLMSHDGIILEEQTLLIKPEGFEIPQEATEIHGISNQEANEMGIPVHDAIVRFCVSARKADLLVAHNLSYDSRILLTELIRMGKRDLLPSLEGTCTMRSSARFCGIPGRFGKGFKWPSLPGLYHKLYDRTPESAHRALVDAKTCAACYFELIRRGVTMQSEDITKIFFRGSS
jgi:DNA polymerase III epsilon subunit-like protein